MKHTPKPIVRQLPLLVFVLAVLFTGYTAYCFVGNFTDSDMASELVLGQLLAEQNRIMTSDWFYSTEIRIFNNNLVYFPLFKIFNDWQTIRFACIFVFMLLLLFSYLYLCRQLRMGWNAYFLSASLMLLPMNVMYGRMILYQNYYVPHMIYGFLIAGLYLSIIRRRGQGRRWQRFRFALLIAVSFVGCVNGFRLLPFVLLPLLLVTLFTALRDYRNNRHALSGDARSAVMAAAVLCVSGLAGLLLHLIILPHYSGYDAMGRISLRFASPAQIRYITQSFLGLFGYQEGRMLRSMGGMVNLAALCAAAVTLFFSVCAFFRRESSLPRAVAGVCSQSRCLLRFSSFCCPREAKTIRSTSSWRSFGSFPSLACCSNQAGFPGADTGQSGRWPRLCFCAWCSAGFSTRDILSSPKGSR